MVYYRWRDTPRVGQVVVTDRAGTTHQVLGEVEDGNSQGGARQQWIGDRTAAYRTMEDGRGMTRVVTLDGTVRTLSGALRMYSPANRMGLSSTHENRIVGDDAAEETIYLMAFDTGELRPLFTRADVAVRHPLLTPDDDIATMTFKHTKWSPDGTRFFVVFSNEAHLSRSGKGRRIKSLFLADADGSNLRYLAEFGHHPMWGGDGRYVYAFSPSPEGGQDVTCYPLDGEASVLMRGIAGVHASLSPDGSMLVTDIFDWPEHRLGAIHLYDVAGGAPRTLAAFRLHDTSHATGCHPHPVWSRDGRRVYFNADDGDTPRLYAVDL